MTTAAKKTNGHYIELEHREDISWDLAVYKAGPDGKHSRHIDFVVRIGRSTDRDQLFPQEPTPENPDAQAKKLPPGRAYYDQSMVGEIGGIHSPVVQLTTAELDALLSDRCPGAKWLQTRIDDGRVSMTERTGKLDDLPPPTEPARPLFA